MQQQLEGKKESKMRNRNIWRPIITIIMSMTLFIGCMTLITLAEDGVPSMVKESMTIRIGQLSNVELNDIPEGATVSYKSSNAKVVKVSSKGKLTPKKTGKAVVKATVKYDGKEMVLKCNVKVNQAIVAVIDGGAAKGQKVWKALKTSSAGAHGPSNGHAKRMIDTIKKEAPKAKILSIKVTDKADKYIDELGVIEALKLAKKYKASVVYYSFYGGASAEEYELVSELIDSGVRVVGPAGNNYGKDARKVAWLTNMEGATSVGAWGNGKILAKSNKHANLYVKAGSTSAAAARYAGMLANGKVYGIHK